MVRILKPLPTATVLKFLLFISGIKHQETSIVKLKEIQFRFKFVCAERTDGTCGLTIGSQSEVDAVQSFGTERMEIVGSCILHLLQSEFKSSPVLGLLFVHCLEHLALLLCRKTGYVHPKEEVGQRNS